MSLRETFETFGRAFVFKAWREPLRQYMLKAGFQGTPYAFFGVLFILLILIASGVYLGLVYPLLVDYSPLIIAGVTLVYYLLAPSVLVALIALGVYFVLNIFVFNRTKIMEQALPDYLQLVTTNLKSGMNFEQSLWAAARPEFGILSAEIQLVSKKVMTGNDTSEALLEFVQRYDSTTLKRNFQLIISEIQSGGEVVHVIERVITSLKRTNDLKEELAASVLSFMIFIAIIVIVLAPILFALANTLLEVIVGFAELIGNNVGSTSGLGGAGAFIKKLGQLAARKEELLSMFSTFSYIAIGITAFFSSLIVSIIEKGDVRAGVRYIPLFTVLALVVFGVFLKVLGAVFSGLFA